MVVNLLSLLWQQQMFQLLFVILVFKIFCGAKEREAKRKIKRANVCLRPHVLVVHPLVCLFGRSFDVHMYKHTDAKLGLIVQNWEKFAVFIHIIHKHIQKHFIRINDFHSSSSFLCVHIGIAYKRMDCVPQFFFLRTQLGIFAQYIN